MHTRSRAFRALAAVLLVGCTATTPVPPAAPSEVRAEGPRVFARRPELQVELRGPKEARYDPVAFGLNGKHVNLTVKNVSALPQEVRGLQVVFAAVRAGVSFPCQVRSLSETRIREPQSLQPGESYAYERDVDCRLALPGHYEVTVHGRFGAAPDAASGQDLAGTFSLELPAPAHAGPRPHPGKAGLYVAISGDPFMRAVAPSEEGKYRAVVALINGSPKPIELKSPRIVARVVKVGQSLSCLEDPKELHPPSALAPGAVYTESVLVSCVVGQPGEFEVRTLFEAEPGDARPLELDGFRLTVTNDPRLYAVPSPLYLDTR